MNRLTTICLILTLFTTMLLGTPSSPCSACKNGHAHTNIQCIIQSNPIPPASCCGSSSPDTLCQISESKIPHCTRCSETSTLPQTLDATASICPLKLGDITPHITVNISFLLPLTPPKFALTPHRLPTDSPHLKQLKSVRLLI
jgi:hypothetical protein